MIKLIIQTNSMPKQLYLIIFFLYTALSFSKSFTLTAIVYDGSSQEPLIGATIRDNSSDKSCLSNSKKAPTTKQSFFHTRWQKA